MRQVREETPEGSDGSAGYGTWVATVGLDGGRVAAGPDISLLGGLSGFLPYRIDNFSQEVRGNALRPAPCTLHPSTTHRTVLLVLELHLERTRGIDSFSQDVWRGSTRSGRRTRRVALLLARTGPRTAPRALLVLALALYPAIGSYSIPPVSWAFLHWSCVPQPIQRPMRCMRAAHRSEPPLRRFLSPRNCAPLHKLIAMRSIRLCTLKFGPLTRRHCASTSSAWQSARTRCRLTTVRCMPGTSRACLGD